ncbi:MAG: hypothetical protein KDA80_06415, partial [Planctomycetaceae bacterium]|nr:hypothetical protein [Planctomycetaceae bacterium]
MSACRYCGLPVPEPIWDRSAPAQQGSAYCCYGCRFAHAVTQESGEEGAARWTLTQLGLAIFFSMNVMVFTIALWAYNGSHAAPDQQMAQSLADLFRHICLLMSLPVLFLLGRPLLENALEQIRQRVFSTDLLLVGGVIASFVYSVISVWSGRGEIY